MKEQVSKKFQELYGEGAVLFASPGRINLIGEHTDYNGVSSSPEPWTRESWQPSGSTVRTV